ncbi:MAG: hypothetical protein HRU69_05180 [Flammeovirgaceae bacterium]|nr:MAG: hypothetical protein HRU69_05180 [Flammeovirgaceae bacterium]
MRKFTVFVLILIVSAFSVFAQSVKATKETARIKGKNADGFEVELEGTVDEVNTALTKYMKTFAKLKLGANPIATSEFAVGGSVYKSPVYALTKEKGDRTAAWIGIKADEWSPEEAEKINKELERLTYDFGVQFYRDKIQVQIDESVRALQAVERQQQRLNTENKNLNIRLENNQKERVQLEKSLDANKLEYLNLLTKIEQNKKSQDSLAVALEQVKKVVEMHKEKQKKVH